MENENDALDLLLSLQTDEELGVDSPRSPSDEDGNLDTADVVEASGISLQKLSTTQQGEPTPVSKKFNAQTAIPSPSAAPESDRGTGYHSDDSYEMPKRNVTMAAFRDAVRGSLESADSPIVAQANRPKSMSNSLARNQVDVDQHSGLRIRDRLVSAAILSSRFCDLKFVRLQSIKLAGMAANFKGEWATVGVLTEKGQPKLSAAGKTFGVWKLASLDGAVISAFVFGDAYTQSWKESPGAVFAVFNAKVRLDEKSKQPSLSIFNGNQIVMMGSSADYAVCKGKRANGRPCITVVNRRLQGEFCQHHLGVAYQKIKTKRAEISGGYLASAFSGPGTRRAQTVKATPESPVKVSQYSRPIKQLNSADLQKVLSTASNVTSNVHSQGMRFLETRSRHHHDQEQKLLSLKKKATAEPPRPRKKARIPLEEIRLDRAKAQNVKEPAKSSLMELDIDEVDTEMDQARMLFSASGNRGLKAK